jgi:hypothetical protein
VGRTAGLRVRLTTEMRDWRRGKVEQEGELGQPHDEAIRGSNREVASGGWHGSRGNATFLLSSIGRPEKLAII